MGNSNESATNNLDENEKFEMKQSIQKKAKVYDLKNSKNSNKKKPRLK